MGIRDDDDEDQGTDTDENGLKPSTSRDSLEQYLLGLKARREGVASPGYIGARQGTAMNMANQGGTNALAALIGQSASKAGTIGGKEAGSNLGAFEQGQNQANQQLLSGLSGEDQEQERNLSGQEKVAEYLLGKKTQDQIASENRDFKRDQLSEAKRYHDLVAQGKEDAAGGKSDKDTSQRFGKLEHDLNTGQASSRSAMGKQQGMVDSADRVLQLGEQAKTQPGGLDKRQIHELAIATASLVSSGGSGAAQSTVEALVPHSMGSSAAGIEEWLSGSPQGTDQQAFVNRMLETAQREKHLASEKIKGFQADVLSGYSDLEDKDPKRFAATKGRYFGPDAQFAQNGKYVPKPFIGAEAAPGMGTAIAQGGKQISNKQFSPSRNQTKVTYTDGTTEILNGKQ